MPTRKHFRNLGLESPRYLVSDGLLLASYGALVVAVLWRLTRVSVRTSAESAHVSASLHVWDRCIQLSYVVCMRVVCPSNLLYIHIAIKLWNTKKNWESSMFASASIIIMARAPEVCALAEGDPGGYSRVMLPWDIWIWKICCYQKKTRVSGECMPQMCKTVLVPFQGKVKKSLTS